MEALFLKILNMSITATYVLLAVLVLRFIFRRAPKWISYSLWSLVLFRLVCPISFASPLSLFDRLGKTASTDSGGINHIPAGIGRLAAQQVDISTPGINETINSLLPAATPAASVNSMQVLLFAGTWVWLAGLTMMLIYSFTSYLRLKYSIREATLLSDNVFEIDNIYSPFVFGLIKPKIYLPSGMPENEQSFVLRHEQTHIARRDHLIKPFAFFVLSLHWFNPFMWLAFLLMSRDLEMSCDEKVISSLDAGGKAGYSAVLLRFAVKYPFPAGSPLAFAESSTKRRVKNVLNYKKPAFGVLFLAVTAVILAAMCLLTNPANRIKLPGVSLVQSIELEQINNNTSVGKTILTEPDDIKDVISDLSGAGKMRRQSVNDLPMQNNYLIFRINLADRTRTLYLYTEENRYYAEEPYAGIYQFRRNQDSMKAAYEKYVYILSGKDTNDLNGIEIFVWKDSKQVKYSVFQEIKASRTEKEIYEGSMVVTDIAEVNRVIAKYYRDGFNVSIRQMNQSDFTKDEMEIMADSLIIPSGNYSIGIGTYVQKTSPDKSLSVNTAEIKPISPAVSLEQSTGIEMPELDYASDHIVIFHGYFGLFVYDLNSRQIIRSLDLKPLNCQQTQGSNYCDVSVSVDGKKVYLHPMESEDMYIYTVSSHTLQETSYEQMDEEERFKTVLIEDVIASKKLGIYSYNAVRFETEDEYGYLRAADLTLGTLTYVRENMEYKLFDKKEE